LEGFFVFPEKGISVAVMKIILLLTQINKIMSWHQGTAEKLKETR
jgi:hypothetical protein